MTGYRTRIVTVLFSLLIIGCALPATPAAGPQTQEEPASAEAKAPKSEPATQPQEPNAAKKTEEEPAISGGSLGEPEVTPTPLVPLRDIISGGVGPDQIPPIDDPKFVSISEADEWLADQEPIVAVEINGDARAYPLQIMTWHEIVNDEIGGQPASVTFCPLCNTAIVFDRVVEGTVYDFGTSGRLYNSALVMYDRQTGSWWSQVMGQAIVGKLTGTVLDFLPSAIVSWADFKTTFPQGKVLSRDTGFSRPYGVNPYARYDSPGNRPFLFKGTPDPRLPAMERVVGVEINGEAVAYPFSRLAEERVVADAVGGQAVVVFYYPGTTSALDQTSIAASKDVGAAAVFDPVLDGEVLTFRTDDDGNIVDEQTGSTWNVLGEAMAGPMQGKTLRPIVHGNHFWFAWAAFNPDTKVHGSS